MFQRKANIYRLYPTPDQAQQMAQIAGSCRFVDYLRESLDLLKKCLDLENRCHAATKAETRREEDEATQTVLPAKRA